MKPLTPMQLRAFVSQIDTTAGPTECWPWMGATWAFGHGRFGGQHRGAHRIAYELMKRPIPDGLVLDHICRNPPCVNPEHLEPVTQRENVMRSDLTVAYRNSIKTHCKNGHEFTPQNTYVQVLKTGPRRDCRACNRERAARSYRRRAAAKATS